MLRLTSLIFMCLGMVNAFSQNDIDAIRYSQNFFGGNSRNKAMAGSFGAIGADGSCMGINPAGIGLYKKGDINISFGLRTNFVEATHNANKTSDFKINLPFDGISLITAFDSKLDKDIHHAFGISCNQIANYNSKINISGISNNKSIMQDVLATAGNNSIKNLDETFAGLAYQVYLLDTIDAKYYSLVNTKYDVTQSKTIETTGRNNEWCLNYAAGYKDKLYIGATIGISSINYNYSSTYTEVDSNDSIRRTNYNYPVWYYPSQKIGGFKDLTYKESFNTRGNGANLKLGIIYRLASYLRMGASFHSPTFYNLNDTYNFDMIANYDEGGRASTEDAQKPLGKYNYRIITPMKFTGSIAFLYKKQGVINVDYDILNYGQANLQNDGASVFTGVNQVIRNKYNQTSNVRVGAELNMKPVFIRLGYAMFGSPFGNTFTGKFVNSFYTGGIGLRNDKIYLDISFTQRISSENYYMYNPNYVDKTSIKNFGTTIGITVGSKF